MKLYQSIIFTILFYGSGIGSPLRDHSDDDLQKLLVDAMNNFGGWLNSSNLDPTSSGPRNVSLNMDNSFANVTGAIWNQVLSGHSNYHVLDISSEISCGAFGISIILPLDVVGEYSIQGSLKSTFPVNGQGLFMASKKDFIIDIGVFGLEITSEGFVSMERANIYYGVVLPTDVKLYFEDLSAGGLKKELVNRLRNLYNRQIWNWFPLHQYIVDYLKEVFAVTPISLPLENSNGEATSTRAPCIQMSANQVGQEANYVRLLKKLN